MTRRQYSSENFYKKRIYFSKPDDEAYEAIKNDRPIPVSQEQFDLINAMTKLMLSRYK